MAHEVFASQPAIETAIQRLPYLPAHLRERQVGRIIGLLFPSFRVWARGWCERSGRADAQDAEEAVQVAAEHALHILRKHAAGGHSEVRAWMPYLNQAATYQVLRWLKSPAASQTGITGLVSAERRGAQIPKAIEQTRLELGREPTATEVAELFNSDMFRRRKNPAKSGVLLTAEDVMPYLS